VTYRYVVTTEGLARVRARRLSTKAVFSSPLSEL
jgi:hypothetical protein